MPREKWWMGKVEERRNSAREKDQKEDAEPNQRKSVETVLNKTFFRCGEMGHVVKQSTSMPVQKGGHNGKIKGKNDGRDGGNLRAQKKIRDRQWCGRISHLQWTG
uniref:Uncharacterized protein n=1 Tax=Caenorhabditis japonica TaxID=281687 RepID=A0A8R1ET03_CAEJA